MLKGLAAALAAVLASWPLAVPATASTTGAAPGRIDHADTRQEVLRILYSLPELPPGAEPDLASVAVTVQGEEAEATAEPAATAKASRRVRRTAILAIDTSRSMRGERFVEAKAAAKAFLTGAPSDVYVGIVAFAGDVEVVQRPTLDRASASTVIDELELTLQTRLYDGVITAARAAGDSGLRRVLVLSDGRDTSETPLDKVVATITSAEVRVDVVALAQAAAGTAPLEAMAGAGGGEVLATQDPEALTALFDEEAAALSRQMLVTASLPADLTAQEGSVVVAMDAGGTTYEAAAFLSFGARGPAEPEQQSTAPQPVPQPFTVDQNMMWIGLGALGLGLLVVVLGATGALGRRDRESVESTISPYTRAGTAQASRVAAARSAAAAGESKSVADSAVVLAEKALGGSAGFESRLAGKLESADLSLKPAEWLLLHASAAVTSAAVGFLLGSGGWVLTLVFLVIGIVLPWAFLGIRKSRRQKAFNGQLADTLQLVAGSLSAGLSLAQSLDTVVREGSDPVAAEFRRALIETRLGVSVEEALNSVASRMESPDFEWVVMAIKIQREVGGNLSELLLKVAATMRERDYLRRQVRTLSAEGRLSGWILSALPPAMLAYMLVTNPRYVMPMFQTAMGWLMLGAAVVLLALGGFWMSRVVKVEV